MENTKDNTISVEEHERITQALYDEIKRKDKIIKDIKEENLIIMRTALRGSKELERWKEFAEKKEEKDLKDNIHKKY